MAVQYCGLRTNWLTNVSGSGLRVGVIHKLKWLLANVFTNEACDSDLVSGGRERLDSMYKDSSTCMAAEDLENTLNLVQ